MSTDGTFAAIVAASFLLFLSGIVAFFGTRLFWIILPVWGFFFGLAVGAQGVQALFGDGFLSTGFSWIVAFFLGLLFALLSYLFWFLAVSLIGGYLGYGIVVGFFGLIGVNLGPLVWIVGVAVGIVAAVLTMVLNVQKWVVVIGTSLLGAAGVVGTDRRALQPADAAAVGGSPGQGRDRCRGRLGRVGHRDRRDRSCVPDGDHPSVGDRALQPLERDVSADHRHVARTALAARSPSARALER